jgi:ABC-type branched-subunit amino acid transport system ATPase component
MGVLETPSPRMGDPTAERNPALLSVQDITRVYGGVHAVDGVSFDVPQGTIVGLIGPNGAGKSTVLKCVSGTRPSSGRVFVDGQDVTDDAPHQLARRGVIRTFQLASIFPQLTVMENLLAGVRGHPGETLRRALLGKAFWRHYENDYVAEARTLLAEFNMSHKENDYAGDLSGGQKRLVEIMRALMSKARILLLDEPMTGVSPDLCRRIEEHLHRLRAEGLTMLLVEHGLGAVERLCDDVFVMAQGKIIAHGSMAEIRANRSVVDAYLVG